MPTPTRDELRNWAETYVETWNSGDKQAWVANWKRVAPGKFQMLDPVGTPEKVGFDDCAAKSYDLFQPRVQFRIKPGTLFVCDNEVAWLLENRITVDGKESVAFSIETYRFGDDGSVTIRTYYKVPPRNEGELGEMFEQYLPENG